MRKSPFKVGQVVKITADFYEQGDRKAQQYQRITKVWPWGWRNLFGYDFANGDVCSEKFIRALTSRERGSK